MSARVVRMINGEDVIADVKEVRESNDGPALAYKLTQPYTVTIQQPPEVTFETDAETAITDFTQLDRVHSLCTLLSRGAHLLTSPICDVYLQTIR